jgi:hypothetical protein
MHRGLWPVRWWVRLYTARLDPLVSSQRRAELESDLWEQSRWAMADQLHGLAFLISVWTRCLRGIPDDLAWRAERAALTASRTGSGRDTKALTGIATALGMALLLVVINTIAYVAGSQPSGSAATISLALVSAVTVLAIVLA